MDIFDTFLRCFIDSLLHCTSMYSSVVNQFASRTVFKKIHISLKRDGVSYTF